VQIKCNGIYQYNGLEPFLYMTRDLFLPALEMDLKI
jgi:hypothetical protein